MEHQNRFFYLCFLFTLLAAFFLFSLPSLALAGRVELVLTAAKTSPITAMQDWTRALGAAGVHNVRIRQQTRPGQPTIETRSVAGQKVYLVRGTIEGSGRISLPGNRFEPGEAKRLAVWLDDIAQKGPPAERESTDQFGLPLSVAKKIAVDLAIPISFGTDGSSRAAVILQANKVTRFPILAKKSMMKTLDKDKVPDDLKGFAAGTVLAYLVEPFGLGLFPGKDRSGRLAYQIVERSSRDVKPWPIGWKPKNRIKTLPGLFKTKSINVERIPISQVLKVISKRLEVPVLIDRAALARKRIDPTKVTVSFPDKRTNFDRALGNMMSEARLKYELRIDDAGRPFLWVTTLAKK